MELDIYLPVLHVNQKHIITNAKRFNVAKCGRRFGKTSLIEELTQIVIDGKFVGIWFPTYKDLSEVWELLKRTFFSIIQKKDEALKQIKFITGGILDFWSMEDPDSGRGRKYHRAIMDEFAKAKKNKQAWEKTIRPTLTDYKGDAWFLSTPMGKLNSFYEVCQRAKTSPNWAFFHFTSYDNPFLDPEEIEDAKNQVDDLSFKQEYLAEDVDLNDKPYLYSFDESKHVKEGLEINPHLPVWFSFDFNVDPMTCIVGQRMSLRHLRVIREIRLPNADIYEMCERLKVLFPQFLPYCLATGDASGRNRHGASKGRKHYWMIIKEELRLKDSQLKVRSKNMDFSEDRPLQNSILQHAVIEIDKRCKELIIDCDMARVDEHGQLIKSSMEGRHFFDCYRYLANANFPDWIANFRKYKTQG